MKVLDHKKDILVDEEGYNQYMEMLELLKMKSNSVATSGNEEYLNAVGDGWHDNFAFEESMRESRAIANQIDKMYLDKKRLKIINREPLIENLINIGDKVELEIQYNDTDIDKEIIKLTGKYIPDTDNDINEVSLNSPIGSAIYKRKIGSIVDCVVNERVITIKIIKKI